jgi:hypothetical protein
MQFLPGAEKWQLRSGLSVKALLLNHCVYIVASCFFVLIIIEFHRHTFHTNYFIVSCICTIVRIITVPLYCHWSTNNIVYNITCISKVKLSRYMTWRFMGERRKISSYLTSALDGCEWSASRPGRALPAGKGPPIPIVQEAGWFPEPVWTQRLEEKSSASVGDRTTVVQSVVSHYTDWATAAAIMCIK